jgi:hypothetical protein
MASFATTGAADLTDADINWLSDLSEEMEQFEPPTPIAVMGTMDDAEQNLEGTARSTKKRCSTRIANRDARAQPQETAARPAAALSTPPRATRKRKSHTPLASQLVCRSTRQYNTRPSGSDAALANSEDQAEHIHSATEAVNDQRRFSECLGWIKLLDPSRSSQEGLSRPRGASHRPDPMSTSQLTNSLHLFSFFSQFVMLRHSKVAIAALKEMTETRRSTSPMTSPLGCVRFHLSTQSLPTPSHWTMSLFSHPGTP